MCSGAGDSAARPCGLASVSVLCSRRRSAKLYISTLCSSATTILSRRSRTARTCGEGIRVCQGILGLLSTAQGGAGARLGARGPRGAPRRALAGGLEACRPLRRLRKGLSLR